MNYCIIAEFSKWDAPGDVRPSEIIFKGSRHDCAQLFMAIRRESRLRGWHLQVLPEEVALDRIAKESA